jgi:hypothetical protein
MSENHRQRRPARALTSEQLEALDTPGPATGNRVLPHASTSELSQAVGDEPQAAQAERVVDAPGGGPGNPRAHRVAGELGLERSAVAMGSTIDPPLPATELAGPVTTDAGRAAIAGVRP